MSSSTSFPSPSTSPSTSSTEQGLAPPLLPAFLITGLFVCCAVALMGWRYVHWHSDPLHTMTSLERELILAERRSRLQEKAVEIPRLWDVWAFNDSDIKHHSLDSDWSHIQPLSVTASPTNSATTPGQDPMQSDTKLQVACLVSMPNSACSVSASFPIEYAIGIVDAIPSLQNRHSMITQPQPQQSKQSSKSKHNSV